MKTDITQRLQEVCRTQCNNNRSAMAAMMHCSQPTVTNYLEGRDPAYRFLAAIIEAYPHISPDWLLLGKGDMYRQEPDYDAVHGPDAIMTSNYIDHTILQQNQQLNQRNETLVGVVAAQQRTINALQELILTSRNHIKPATQSTYSIAADGE